MATNNLSFHPAFHAYHDHQQIPVTKVSGGPNDFLAYVYRCSLDVDIDGAPNAYGPPDASEQGLHPLEWLSNAASPYENYLNHSHNFYWAGVYSASHNDPQKGIYIDKRSQLAAHYEGTDKHGKLIPAKEPLYPVVQQTGATKGYYVSTTSVKNPGFQDWETGRYMDATALPYAVWGKAAWLNHHTQVQLGDFGLAIPQNPTQATGFFFGDSNRSDHVGECSYYLIKQLGMLRHPTRTVRCSASSVTFIVFPGSSGGSTSGVTEGSIITALQTQFRKLGRGLDSTGFTPDTSGYALELCNFLARKQGCNSWTLWMSLMKFGFPPPVGDFPTPKPNQWLA